MATDVETGYCLVCDRRRAIERKGVNHILHLLLSVFTAGIWLLVWLLACLVREPWHCRQCGSKDVMPGDRAASRIVARVHENPNDDLTDILAAWRWKQLATVVGIAIVVVLVIAVLAH